MVMGRPAEPPPVQTSGATSIAARVVEQPNPTFGLDYWLLGLVAALPTLVTAAALLICAGVVPALPRLPTGGVLGAVVVLLFVAAIGAYLLNFPAWSQPAIVLIPTLLLVLPVAIMRRQVIWQINGDTDSAVLAPLLVLWLLLLAAVIVSVVVAMVVGQHAPSFSGIALTPLLLIDGWLLVLTPRYSERLVLLALGSAFALAALTTFVAWIVPTSRRPYLPLLAIAVQLGAWWLQQIGWPHYAGLVRWVVGLDLLLLLGLLFTVVLAPVLASWVRRDGWPAFRAWLQ